CEVAEKNGIPYTITASPRYTSTDADAIYLTRAGVATGLISVPNRYMHSPNELVSLEDLDRAARLIAAFVRELGPDTDFVPRLRTLDSWPPPEPGGAPCPEQAGRLRPE